ncbi:DNA-binding IclR family transcriptional regulator [Naumannella halotolerans]|uniref:DNA-binding IclR family transcriptional regulator n=1 Tax=Naumannella halotolerans TaxID=993414 RepID=A0A4R7J0S3_9ACTN|nr:DNA-binding IclR family transcriptional regulator [Naumannella halotolerans]
MSLPSAVEPVESADLGAFGPRHETRQSGARVPAVRNAVALLRELARNVQPVSAGALARSLHIPRSSTYQLLQTLVEEGLVVHVPDAHGYALGGGVAELGSAYSQRSSLENLARPHLTRLARTIQESAALSILQGDEVLYLSKVQPARPIALVTDKGVRLPAHLTASGRAILARLPRREVLAHFADAGPLVRLNGQGPSTLRELRDLLTEDLRRGWSIEKGCVSRTVTCISAAVTDRTDRPTAAVTVSFLSHKRQDHLEIADAVCRAAADLSRALGSPCAGER